MGRGGGNLTFLVPLGHFLMYVNLFSGVALMTKYCQKINPLGIYAITWDPWHLKNGGVWRF